MRYAIIQTGGKQYRVAEGDTITVERLPLAENSEFICNDVLLYQNDGTIMLGKPFLADFSVKGQLLSNFKGEKIRVGKYKAKARYRRVAGHRQSLSKVHITQIGDSLPEAKVEKKIGTAKKTA